MLPSERLHEDLDGLVADLFSDDQSRRTPTPPENQIPVSFDPPLDTDQSTAAGLLDGPVRVLAPAGSGKTRTLTARIGLLIASGAAPERILALAFNTRAAVELRDRLAQAGCMGVDVRTFHALGYAVLRSAGGSRFSEESEAVIAALAETIARRQLDFPGHPGAAKRLLAAIMATVSAAKSSLLGFDAMRIEIGERSFRLDGVFRELLREQQGRGLLSFSDMIYFAVSTLVEDPVLRHRWQAGYDHILVDEFQDLNAAQMLLLRILAHPADSLFVVGDDDQLIYAWRGAEEAHILAFNSLYPQAQSVVLTTNYRSAHRIVRSGRRLIENNPVRVDKAIRPRRDAPAGQVAIRLAGSDRAQAEAAAAWIRETIARQHLSWSDCGVLFRLNRDSEILATVFREQDIPFISIARDGLPDNSPGKPAVTLATIHRTKGLEFPAVVYFNLRRRAAEARQAADERRVAYVGVTRASGDLLITADREAYSPFLVELALEPGLANYSEDYLARQLNLHRRHKAWRARDWRGWVRSFAWNADVEDEPAGPYDEAEDSLVMELRFRKALGISRQP